MVRQRAAEQQPHWSNGVGPPCESPVVEDRLQFRRYRSGRVELQYRLRFMAARLGLTHVNASLASLVLIKLM